jgi:hypothetical protein
MTVNCNCSECEFNVDNKCVCEEIQIDEASICETYREIDEEDETA